MKSIKEKAKELATKGKEYVVEHGEGIVLGLTGALIAVGGYMIGCKSTEACIARGLERIVANKVVGFGTFKDGSFVEVTIEEAADLVQAYATATL